MIKFHAVMLDETGCEFGVGVEAASRSVAYEKLAEDYPESRCVQLESPEDTAARERRMMREIDEEYGWYDDSGDEVDDDPDEMNPEWEEVDEEQVYDVYDEERAERMHASFERTNALHDAAAYRDED